MRSDVERKRLFGVPPEARLAASAYAPEVSDQVYAMSRKRAMMALLGGQAVIVDAVHAKPEEREELAALAAKLGVPFTGLWLEAPAKIMRDRVATRKGDVSDATPSVVDEQLGYDLGPQSFAVIDASLPARSGRGGLPRAHRRAEPLIYALLTVFGRQSRSAPAASISRALPSSSGASNKPLRGVGTLRFVGQSRLARIAGGLSLDAGALGPAGFIAPLFLMRRVLPWPFGLRLRQQWQRLGERVIALGQPVPKGGGVYQIGKPYEISGLTYTPREEPGYDRVGNASWYGELFHGRRTANGEIYDMDRLSAAHPTLPLPVYARVTNLNNGRTIVVRINDRGPYARDRIIDLSRRSAELLGFRNNGTATVRVKYLGRAPLDGDDSYERNYLASQGWMRVASKGKSSKDGAVAVSSTLPAENPENLARPWKAGGPA